jgi:hypothetical protein
MELFMPSKPRVKLPEANTSGGYLGVYHKPENKDAPWEARYKGRLLGNFKFKRHAKRAVKDEIARLTPKKKMGRKEIPITQRHQWTLDEIMVRCGAENIDECWDEYTGMHGQRLGSEQARRHPAIIHGGVLRVQVRHLAWLLAHGEDPPEGVMLVMEKCDNPYCQNPHHAKPMWEKQKSVHRGAQGRMSNPSRSRKIAKTMQARHSKLANGMETAREIRADTTPAKEEPWKKYGICRRAYLNIKQNKAWVDYEQGGAFAAMAARMVA